jgi:exopolysaccharide biosynthesis polyprenyl glycosylphosphotransferase
MFREHARLFIALQFLSDIALSLLAFPLAYITRLHLDKIIPAELDQLLNPALHPLTAYFWMISLAIGWWAIAAFSLGLYRISIRKSGWEKIKIVLESSILLGLFLGFLSFALKLDLSRPLIALFMTYQAILLSSVRMVMAFRSLKKNHGSASTSRRNILILGDKARAREMGEVISKYSDWGLRILGYVETKPDSDNVGYGDVLGSIADLPTIIEENVVDEIVFVGSSLRDFQHLDEVLEICREQGINTRVAADIFPAKISNLSMEFLESVPLITFSTTPNHALALLTKRIMDIVISAVLLLVLFPFMAFFGLLIKLTSKGPMLYRQVRCGLYGRKFVLYKFRSMRQGAEDILWEIRHLNEMDGPVFKMRNDPRVTPLGRFLRKSSIDELPQLWNVLRGEMSLVGPRAPLPEEVKEYSRWQRRRLSVKPGITCLWQISGRNEIDFHEWMKLDLLYIDNWSLLLDIKILLRTFPVVLIGKGAR